MRRKILAMIVLIVGGLVALSVLGAWEQTANTEIYGSPPIFIIHTDSKETNFIYTTLVMLISIELLLGYIAGRIWCDVPKKNLSPNDNI